MKKAFLLFVAVFISALLSVNALSSDVVISATQFPGFSPPGIGTTVTKTSISVTNGSATVTCSSCFDQPWLGLGGYTIQINGVQYVVSSVASRSSLTLTTTYSGSTSSAATITWFPFIHVRVYADRSFRPAGANYEIQPGVPGSSAWYKRFAASVINDGSTSTLYIPNMTVAATTDGVDNQNARYVFGFYRPDGSLIQYYTCSPSVAQLRVPPTSPTTLPDLCIFNQGSPGPSIPDDYYTKRDIDNRFPSCTAGQVLGFTSTGQVTACVTISSSSLRVKEIDESPNVSPVTTIRVTNGTLTDDGSGQVTIQTLCGTGATTQIMVWSGSTTCTGYSSFTYDDSVKLARLSHTNTLPVWRIENTNALQPRRLDLRGGDGIITLANFGIAAQINLMSGGSGPAFPTSGQVIGELNMGSADAIDDLVSPGGFQIQVVTTQTHTTGGYGSGVLFRQTANGETVFPGHERMIFHQTGAVGIWPNAIGVTSTLGAQTKFFVGDSVTWDANATSQFSNVGTGDRKILVLQMDTGQTVAPLEIQDAAGNAIMSWGALGSQTFTGTASAIAVSPASKGRIYFDTNSQKFKCSENGGSYVNCIMAATSDCIANSDNKEVLYNNAGTCTGANGFEYQAASDPNVFIRAQGDALTALRIRPNTSSQTANLFEIVEATATANMFRITANGIPATPFNNVGTLRGSVFGSDAVLSGNGLGNGTAFGDSTSVEGTGGTALGDQASVGPSADYSIAIGYQTGVTAANTFAVGSPNGAISEVSIGNGRTAVLPGAVTYIATGGSSDNIPGADIKISGGSTIGASTSHGNLADGRRGSVVLQTHGVTGNGVSASNRIDRMHMNGVHAVPSANNTAQALFEISLATLKGTGGYVSYIVYASDGTDVQTCTSAYMFAAVNKAGSYTTDIDLITTSNAASTGTLTCVASITTGTNKIIFNVTPNTSLTPTSGNFWIQWAAHQDGEQAVTNTSP